VSFRLVSFCDKVVGSVEENCASTDTMMETIDSLRQSPKSGRLD